MFVCNLCQRWPQIGRICPCPVAISSAEVSCSRGRQKAALHTRPEHWGEKFLKIWSQKYVMCEHSNLKWFGSCNISPSGGTLFEFSGDHNLRLPSVSLIYSNPEFRWHTEKYFLLQALRNISSLIFPIAWSRMSCVGKMYPLHNAHDVC